MSRDTAGEWRPSVDLTVLLPQQNCGCRCSCMPQPHCALSSRKAPLMQDCNRVASKRMWRKYAKERGLKAPKGGKL